jgi:hypothetical protein
MENISCGSKKRYCGLELSIREEEKAFCNNEIAIADNQKVFL